MRCFTVLPRVTPLVVASCTLTGCSLAGAPSFQLFGAFFPAWMLCALIGVIGAAGTRVVLTNPTFRDLIPFPLATCKAAGFIVGLLVWMILFR
ncbi:MAG: hypothetical protein JO208_03950 [Alphaproteobacteria bacterium]|nr:hypothetical protein [Alphaproteobacteria bacterium]